MYPEDFTAGVDTVSSSLRKRACDISPDSQGLFPRPWSLWKISLIQRAWYLSLGFAGIHALCVRDCCILCLDFYRSLCSPLITLRNSARDPVLLCLTVSLTGNCNLDVSTFPLSNKVLPYGHCQGTEDVVELGRP